MHDRAWDWSERGRRPRGEWGRKNIFSFFPIPRAVGPLARSSLSIYCGREKKRACVQSGRTPTRLTSGPGATICLSFCIKLAAPLQDLSCPLPPCWAHTEVLPWSVAAEVHSPKPQRPLGDSRSSRCLFCPCICSVFPIRYRTTTVRSLCSCDEQTRPSRTKTR